jgi:PDZ domain-containing secreted protein
MTSASIPRVVAVVLLLGTAGCVGGLTGGDGGGVGGPLSFSANPISISEDAVSSTEFELMEEKPITFEETFEVQGQSQTVEMNAHTVQLQRTYEGAPLGSMVLLSVPQVRILGQQIDVVERLDPESMVSRAQGESGDLQREQKIDEFSTQALGDSRTVEVYRGTSEREDSETKVRIYVTTFDHEGDTMIGVGIVPESAGSERKAVRTLLGGLQYG